MNEYKWHCPIRVQAKDKTEAKMRLEYRLKALLLHPDGIDKKDIQDISPLNKE